MTPLILTSLWSLYFSLQALESCTVNAEACFMTKARTRKPTSAFSSFVHTLLVAVSVARSRTVQSQCEEGPGTGSSENPGPSLHLEGPAVSHKAVKSGY